MVKLFFDIETLPCDESIREIAVAVLRGRKNNEGKSEEELYHDTGLDGTFGKICCIGYIKEDGEVTKGVLKGDETEILRQFWEIASDVNLFIGHNAWGFDLPFIFQRSIILGVKARNINMARYRDNPIYDTMKVWALWNMEYEKQHKLETLAKILGLPSSKEDMDGSMVWDYYQAGKLDDICKYCMKDVELTRQVYYKMVFEEMPGEIQVEEVLF